MGDGGGVEGGRDPRFGIGGGKDRRDRDAERLDIILRQRPVALETIAVPQAIGRESDPRIRRGGTVSGEPGKEPRGAVDHGRLRLGVGLMEREFDDPAAEPKGERCKGRGSGRVRRDLLFAFGNDRGRRDHDAAIVQGFDPALPAPVGKAGLDIGKGRRAVGREVLGPA